MRRRYVNLVAKALFRRSWSATQTGDSPKRRQMTLRQANILNTQPKFDIFRLRDLRKCGERNNNR